MPTGFMFRSVQSLNSLPSSIIKISCRGDCKTRLFYDLLSIVHIGSFQADNKRNLQFNRLAGIDYSVSNSSTVHNTPEYINKDCFHPFILCDDAERLLNLVLLDTPSNIQEVGWLSSIQFDDVHGSHSQACSINQAANVSVQLDIVQVVLGSVHLPWLRLSSVLHIKNSFLSE